MQITADGNYGDEVYRNGLTLHLSGTYGGGTAKLQFWDDEQSTWVDFGTDFTWTSGQINKIVYGTRKMRLNLAGATAPSLNFHVTEGILT